MRSRDRLRGVLADPIGEDDVIVLETEPVTLAPGHPLRGQRCLVCGGLIGGLVHRTITVLDFRLPGCSCGQVAALTFLVCGLHPMPADHDLHLLAIRRYGAHHGKAAT